MAGINRNSHTNYTVRMVL